jgi:predicted ATPase
VILLLLPPEQSLYLQTVANNFGLAYILPCLLSLFIIKPGEKKKNLFPSAEILAPQQQLVCTFLVKF